MLYLLPHLAVLAAGLAVEAAGEGLLRGERHCHGGGAALQAHCKHSVLDSVGTEKITAVCVETRYLTTE